MKRFLAHIAVTITAFFFVIVHLFRPDLKVDAVTIVLLGIAALPWLGFIFQSIEVPGYGKVEYRDFEKAALDANKVGLLSPEPQARATKESAMYLRIADEDPNLALAGLRIEIENKLRAIAESHGISAQKKALGQLLTILSAAGVLSLEEQSVLRDLAGLLNQAVHGAKVDRETAQWAIDMGPRILAALDSRIAREDAR